MIMSYNVKMKYLVPFNHCPAYVLLIRAMILPFFEGEISDAQLALKNINANIEALQYTERNTRRSGKFIIRSIHDNMIDIFSTTGKTKLATIYLEEVK